MSMERLKISGWAVCTAHSWHVENASEKVFPAVILRPLAGRIPNRRIIPRFIALDQFILPDMGELYAMCFQTNRYFSEIGNVVDWIKISRITIDEFQELKVKLGEPFVFEIDDNEDRDISENIKHDGCSENCNFPSCSVVTCIRFEKKRFIEQYKFFKQRARVKYHAIDSGELSPEEFSDWAKKNLKSGYE